MKRIYTFLLVLLIITNIYTQNKNFVKGKYFIRNFDTKELNQAKQNWSIVESPTGKIYFGNNHGVLEFDGTNWNLIKLPNESVVRTLAYINDTLFVAGNNEFGFLSTDSFGRNIYVSLSDILPESNKIFGDIWRIILSNNKVYFIGKHDIFIYFEGKITNISLDFELISALNLSNKLIIIDSASFYRIQNNNLEKIYSFNKPIDDRSFVFKLNTDELVVINKEPFKINLKAILSNKKNFIEKLKIDHLEDLPTKNLFDVDIDKNGNMVFAAINGGYIYNKNFKLLYKIDKQTGLAANDITNVEFDSYGNIWLTTSDGISYMEFNSPFTFLDKDNNVSETNLRINIYKNKLYLSSLKDIKILKKGENRFYNFKTESYNNFGSTLYKTKTDSALILSNGSKLYYTFGDSLKFLFEFKKNPEIIMSLLWTPMHKDYIFIGGVTNFGYIKIKQQGQKLEVDTSVQTNVKGMFYSMAADNSGNLWLAPLYSKIIKLEFNEETNKIKTYKYGKEKKLPENQNFISFFNQLNKPLIMNNNIYSIKGNYNPNQTDYSFEKSPWPFNKITDERLYYTFSKGNNTIFIGTKNVYSMKFLDTNTVVIDSILYNRILEYRLSGKGDFDNKGNIWFTCDKIIIKQDTSKNKDLIYIPKPVLLTSLLINNDTVYCGNDTNILTLNSELKYNNNSLTFNFSLPFYIGKNYYKYKLEGFDKEWSEFSEENKAIYTNLDEGDYTFKVITRNVYGIKTSKDLFKFTILPPWYRTIWAYILYFLIFILIILLLIYLFTRNLKARNKRLEEIVKERTKEIRDKNVLITDSIKYAKHIQKAVLPSQEIIEKEFKNVFIFFKPRDIVSGDFYWYHKKNNIHYVAVADCTGHGVPGAFMSMIGNTLLNQIIGEPNIDTPSQILGRLNTELKKAFVSSETQDDGMDISVCKIDRIEKTFEISMANHIALLVSGNQIEEIEGDIFSIGGPFAKPEKIEFKNHKFEIKPNTSLYMFSDGYPDQFGGPENKKLMISKLKELILENVHKDVDEQRAVIKEYFVNWKGNTKQIDDVLIIGIKF